MTAAVTAASVAPASAVARRRTRSAGLRAALSGFATFVLTIVASAVVRSKPESCRALVIASVIFFSAASTSSSVASMTL